MQGSDCSQTSTLNPRPLLPLRPRLGASVAGHATPLRQTHSGGSLQTAFRSKEANGGGISTGRDFDIPVPSLYPPQILGPGGHCTALPAGPHLGFWPPLHQQRVGSHGLSLHHLQRLPGGLHLRLSLRLTKEGEVSSKCLPSAVACVCFKGNVGSGSGRI